jgi:hypothetical protein
VAPGRALLDANPEIALHHMHDPNQDRLMAQRMAYLRIKWRRLSPAYQEFLKNHLEPGATIVVSECKLTWPTTQVQDRHYFQFGALGGADAEEFLHGGPRVENYLLRYGSHRLRWEPPAPDADRPEAEWGYDERLGVELEQFASRHGFRLQRLIDKLPHDLSPLVADLYRWWNRQRHVVGNRLLVESFVLLEPFWTIRTGSVPYWMVFNKEPSAVDLQAYLDARDPFDEIYLMLFSHGVESIGLASIQRWKSLLGRARKKGEFLGVDEKLFPRDFASLSRYNVRVREMIAARYPLPAPLSVERFQEFVRERDGQDKVRVELALPSSNGIAPEPQSAALEPAVS